MRTPGITLALLFTIAIGIGSNVSILGFVRGLTRPDFRPSSVDRVVSVFVREAHRDAGPLSYPEYLSVKREGGAFEWIGAARVSTRSITLAGQRTIVPVAAVTSDLAPFLNLSLDEGVVISHRVWQSEFGAKINIRGEQIDIDGVNARVSGVAPDWLEGVYRDRVVDVWMPLEEQALQELHAASRKFWVLGRLRPNVSTRQAQRLIQPIRGLSELRVLPYTGRTPEMAVGISAVGTLLGFAAGAVFFIACANVASFLLGRAFARSHEASVRVALGASRTQLGQELLSDSLVISVAGGAAGTLLAVWTSRVLPALVYEKVAESLVFVPDLFSIIAASTACAGVTIVCGLVPVLVIPHDRPAAVLRRESSGPSSAIRRLRLGLVITQMAGCCVLVLSTAALIDGFRTALVTNAGHRLGHTILASVKAHPDFGLRYFQNVEETTKAIAGVSGIAWAGRLPGSHPISQSFRIEPPELPLREVSLDIASFTAESAKLFIQPAKAGRVFGFAEQACRAAIVNEEAAEKLFDEYTAGRTLYDAASLPIEIIGVFTMRKPDQGTKRNRPTIYYDYTNKKGPTPSPIALAHFRAPIASELARAELDANVVSANYFDFMGVSLIAGQGFANHKSPRECRIGIVNQEAADLYFDGKALGSAIIDDQGRRTTIIGVVNSEPLRTFQRREEPAVYFPMTQDDLPRMTMTVNVRNVNVSVLADLRARIESVPGRGPAPPLITTLDTQLNQTALAPLHIATMIIAASATIALVLSVLGLFGTMSDATRLRRRELAIRIALGAQRWRVIWQVLKEGGVLACAGTLAGMLGSFVVLRVLTGITMSNRSPSIWVWLVAPLVLMAAVAIASVLPARRALVVNPLIIMRDDN